MKSKMILILLSVVISGIFISCSEDDDGGYSKRVNQENIVKFKVLSNTPGAPITVTEFYGGNIIIKDKWEREFITKEYAAHFFATCEDETVLLIGEIYVNGKLKLRKEGNKQIDLLVKDIKR